MSQPRLVGLALVEYFHKASSALIGKLAARDPKTWTAAEIKDLYIEFTGISEQVTGAEADWKKEQAEADAIVLKYEQRVKSAEILNAQAEKETEPVKKEALEKSRDMQMTEIEKMLPDVEREKREAASAKKVYDDMTAFCISFKDQLIQTQAAMEQAERNIRSAEIEEKNAALREQIAKQQAGLQTGSDKINTVLGAMQQVADDKQKKAAATNLRADLLHHTDLETEDPLIKAAMEEAAGHSPVGTSSFADRLAKLKEASA